jgi:hypothetical protein
LGVDLPPRALFCRIKGAESSRERFVVAGEIGRPPVTRGST